MFVDFVEVERITGQVLAPVAVNTRSLQSRHQRSVLRLCVQYVWSSIRMALYVHCAAHGLNWAVVSACSIQFYKNAESYVGEIARFFNYSARRQNALDKAIKLFAIQLKARKLKDACRTRWVYRTDSYVVFLELLPAVHAVLDGIVHPSMHQELGTDWKWDGMSVTKANGFLLQLQSPSFLIAFQILLRILFVLRELTLKLQMQAIDVTYAYKQVNSAVTTLKKMSERSFS